MEIWTTLNFLIIIYVSREYDRYQGLEHAYSLFEGRFNHHLGKLEIYIW